jgi:hypothetical protein
MEYIKKVGTILTEDTVDAFEKVVSGAELVADKLSNLFKIVDILEKRTDNIDLNNDKVNVIIFSNLVPNENFDPFDQGQFQLGDSYLIGMKGKQIISEKPVPFDLTLNDITAKKNTRFNFIEASHQEITNQLKLNVILGKENSEELTAEIRSKTNSFKNGMYFLNKNSADSLYVIINKNFSNYVVEKKVLDGINKEVDEKIKELENTLKSIKDAGQDKLNELIKNMGEAGKDLGKKLFTKTKKESMDDILTNILMEENDLVAGNTNISQKVKQPEEPKGYDTARETSVEVVEDEKEQKEEENKIEKVKKEIKDYYEKEKKDLKDKKQKLSELQTTLLITVLTGQVLEKMEYSPDSNFYIIQQGNEKYLINSKDGRVSYFNISQLEYDDEELLNKFKEALSTQYSKDTDFDVIIDKIKDTDKEGNTIQQSFDKFVLLYTLADIRYGMDFEPVNEMRKIRELVDKADKVFTDEEIGTLLGKPVDERAEYVFDLINSKGELKQELDKILNSIDIRSSYEQSDGN